MYMVRELAQKPGEGEGIPYKNDGGDRHTFSLVPFRVLKSKMTTTVHLYYSNVILVPFRVLSQKKIGYELVLF